MDLSSIKITRVKLYDTFVDHWLDVNKRRLQGNVMSTEDQAKLADLLDAGFVKVGVDFSTKLASAIFEQQKGNPLVQYIHRNDKKSWKADFFGLDPEIRMLRESSPLTRTGSLFRFLHRSMLEYFVSRAVYDPSGHANSQEFPPHPDPDLSLAPSPNIHGPLFTRSLLTEPSIIQFLCERVKQHPDFEKQLLAVIEQSKADLTVATAAANAITILVRAGVRFNGAEFRGIRIPGADLSESQLDSAQLQGADLTNVTFAGSWLRQVDMSGAQTDGVRFGELPFLKEEDGISVCAYSPNGRMLAVGAHLGAYFIGTKDIFLSVYDTTTWNRAYQHSAGRAGIKCIAFSPNNQQLLYGTHGKDVRLWTIANNIILNMEGHAGCVKSVAFSPCGRQCASASKDKTVRLWSSKTGECLFVLEGHADSVTGVMYYADGKRLVSGSSNDGTIRVWDSETGQPVACWSIAHCKYSTLAFSADGQWVAVTLKGKIQITNTVTGEPCQVLNIKGGAVCFAFSSNGQWIVTSDRDCTLRLWDISSGLLISSFSGHAGWIYTSTFSPSCSQIASGGSRGYVRLWEIDTSRAISNLDRSTGPVSTITYSPDGRSILSLSDGQGLQQWDSQTGVSVPLPLKVGDDVSSFALSPSGNQITTGHGDGTIRLWSLQAHTAECTLLGHTERVAQLAYSPCGRWIVSGVCAKVRLWDLHTNEHPGILVQKYQLSMVSYSVALTSTGQILLAPDEGPLRLHDTRARNPCIALKEISLGCRIWSLDCSPDGQELAIGAYDGTVYLWDFQSDKPCIELKGHRDWVKSVAYSTCGKWILSGSHDKTVRVWCFRTGEVSGWYCATVVSGCSRGIACVAWNPAVALEFATGCEDGSIRVWRIASHDNADGGDISVQMLWGNDVGLLCASYLSFKGTIGHSLINQRLLVQRGAIDSSLVSEGGGDGAKGVEVE